MEYFSARIEDRAERVASRAQAPIADPGTLSHRQLRKMGSITRTQEPNANFSLRRMAGAQVG